MSFTIHDTGIGISTERQSAIFRPFEQADGSTTRRYGGTGLGVTIAKRLVEMMSGRIWLESELGVGTTFSFTLLVDAVPSQPEMVGPDCVDLDGLSALIVDDNATNRRILERRLARWGMRTISADSGQTALQILDNLPRVPELMIIDAHMPEMGGFELAAQVKQRTDLYHRYAHIEQHPRRCCAVSSNRGGSLRC